MIILSILSFVYGAVFGVIDALRVKQLHSKLSNFGLCVRIFWIVIAIITALGLTALIVGVVHSENPLIEDVRLGLISMFSGETASASGGKGSDMATAMFAGSAIVFIPFLLIVLVLLALILTAIVGIGFKVSSLSVRSIRPNSTEFKIRW